MATDVTLIGYVSEGGVFFDIGFWCRFIASSKEYYNRFVVSLNVDGELLPISTHDYGQKITQNDDEWNFSFSDDELATIYRALPNADRGVLRLTIYTYSDAAYQNLVGEDYKEIERFIRESNVLPSVSATLSPVNPFSGSFADLYIQGNSCVRADVDAQALYGATVTKIQMSVEGRAYGDGIEASLTSNYLSGSGLVAVKVTVTDSRSFSHTVTQEISVVAYTKPKAIPIAGESRLICDRCDADGNPSDQGTYLLIKAARSYSEFTDGEERNLCDIRYRYRKSNTESFSEWVVLLEGENTDADEVSSGALLNGTLAEDTSYVVQIGAVDSIGNATQTTLFVATARIFEHRAGSLRSWGFGQYVEEENVFAVADDITVKFGGNVAEAVAASGTQESSGLIRYASGLTIQWGQVTITTETADTPAMESVAFAVAYTVVPFVIATPETDEPGTVVTGTAVANITKEGFDAFVTRTNALATVMRWFSIGFTT